MSQESTDRASSPEKSDAITPEVIKKYEDDVLAAYAHDVDRVWEIVDDAEESFPPNTPEFKAAGKRIFARLMRTTDLVSDSVVGMNNQEIEEMLSLIEKDGEAAIHEVLWLSHFNREFLEAHGITKDELREIVEENKDAIRNFELLSELEQKGSKPTFH